MQNNFQVADATLKLLNKQEQMHGFRMQTDRPVGAEVMLFEDGRVAIEPSLSLSSTELNFKAGEIDLDKVKEMLITCSTSFRESFSTSFKSFGKTKVLCITALVKTLETVS